MSVCVRFTTCMFKHFVIYDIHSMEDNMID